MVNPQLRNWKKIPGKTNIITVIFPSTTFTRHFFNPSATKLIILNTSLFCISASSQHQKCLAGDLPYRVPRQPIS